MKEALGGNWWRLLAGLLITAVAWAFLYLELPYGSGIFETLIEQHDIPVSFLFVVLVLSGFLLARKVEFVDRAVFLVACHRHLVAAATVGLVLVGNAIVYRSHPLSMDEYAAVFQAKVFASGRLSGAFPPSLIGWLVPKSFQNLFLIVNPVTGAVASGYWPGFSLLLAPFVFFGLPGACNALIAGATLLMAGRLAYDLTENELARGWAILLCGASPIFVINGISFYAMSAHMLFNLVFAWLLLTPTPRRLIAAGFVGSIAFSLHNPFPHLLFALPWWVWLVMRPRGLRLFLRLCIGYVPGILLLVLGWVWFLEGLRRGGAGVSVASVAGHGPGCFQWLTRTVRGLLVPFSVPDHAVLAFRFAELCKLWLWSVPLLPLFACLGGFRVNRALLPVMALSVIVTILGYCFLPVSQGHGWGARYLVSAWGVLPVLGAAWLVQSRGDCGQHGIEFDRRIALVFCLGSFVALLGVRGWQVMSFMDRHLAQRPAYPADVPSILFIARGYYAYDLVQNDPFLRESVMVVRSKGENEDDLLAQQLLPGSTKYGSAGRGRAYVGASGQLFLLPK